jgi:putative phosphoesterase
MNKITLGVLADTHIPDRARRMDRRILPIFEQARVQAILHAGDVITPDILAALQEVAPVHAVRGNRDYWMLRHLPDHLRLNFNGTDLVLTHGHGPLLKYLQDRIYYIFHGYELDRWEPYLRRIFPQARVIVFGHLHRPINHWVGGQMIFNPGSPHFPEGEATVGTIGLLHLDSTGEVWGEIIPLD